MSPKKSSNAACSTAGVRDDKISISPPFIAIRRSNSVSKSQLNDVSDDDTRYTEKATLTPDILDRSSAEPPITSLQTPIAFLKPSINAAR